MKNKIKLLSIICFIVAMALAFPCISKAYETEKDVPINYTIKINKIDSADNKNLKGARFQLKDKDGKTIATQTTNADGILSFGNLKTYGSGTDIYYIEEIQTPDDYILDSQEAIEVNVQKTITNVETGAYKLKITCQTLNYSTDITRYDFVPVSTVEQLKKIGSNEEFTYKGKKYKYTPNTNYRLMNDIDLAGENWKPIETPISGIFDGDGHSIKNLTINYNAQVGFSEVGLFKSFTGIVEGVNLEDVKINVPSIAPGATSVTGKTGVGAFAAYFGGGTFKDCSVSGNISAGCNNVGGLVGHSAENVIIKFQNCTNNANITVNGTNTYNVGGLIGCAVCSLSVTDCTNNGTINGTASNVGGLVGFVESTGYEEKAVKAVYAEDGNIITLLVGNTKVEGKYDLYLEDHDLQTLNILPGGVFSVYDSSLTPIEGFENITLTEGKIKIGTIDLKYEGKDIYYIKDVTPAPGYRKIAGYMKITVTKKWDFNAKKFKLTVDAKVIAEDKINEELESGSEDANDLSNVEDTDVTEGPTEAFAPVITFEDIESGRAKAAFVNCKNTVEINGYMDVAGILGTSYSKVTMDECKNTGNVNANNYGKAAGLAAEIRTEIGENDAKYANPDQITEIKNSSNEAQIKSTGNYTESAGIVANVLGNITIDNVANKGKIVAEVQSAEGGITLGGIVGDIIGNATITNSTNEGELSNTVKNPNLTNAIAGGIIAKSDYELTESDFNGEEVKHSNANNTITIENCTNKANITTPYTIGGVVGYVENKNVTLNNCSIENAQLKSVFGDVGGLIGVSSSDSTNIVSSKATGTEINSEGYSLGGIAGYVEVLSKLDNNNVKDVTIEGTSQRNNIKNGSIAGMVADTNGQNDAANYTYTNNNVTTLKATSGSNNIAGIIGTSNDNITFVNSKLDDLHLTYTNEVQMVPNGNMMPYCRNIGGLIACNAGLTRSDVAKTSAQNCSLTNSELQGTNGPDGNNGRNSAFTIGGLVGFTNVFDGLNENESDKFVVSSTNIKNAMSQGNTAGIIGNQFYNYQNVDSNIVKINKVELNKVNIYGEQTVGGVTGYAHVQADDVKIKDCILSNELEGAQLNHTLIGGVVGEAEAGSFRKSSFKNISIEGTTIKSTSNQVAGVTPYMSGEVIGCTIKDSTLTSDISAQSLGGVVNINYVSGSEYSSLENCTIDNTTITGGGENNEGFVVGYTCGDLKNNKVINNSKLVSKITPNAYDKRAVGGIAGTAVNEGSIENCEVSNFEVSGVNTFGGIVGATNKSLISNTVTDIKATNIITRAGGIAGIVYSNSVEVKNNTANNVTLEATQGGNSTFSGGIIGRIDTGDLTGNTVNTGTMTATWEAGGIAGSIGNSYNSISNNTVSAVSVTAPNRVGGIAGMITTAKEVNGNKVQNNSKIATNTTNPSVDYIQAGGIVGNINSATLISNCEVSNSSVTGQGHTGGIAGCSGVQLKDNNVKNSTITNDCQYTTVYSYNFTGGIVGYTDRTITNCDVTSTTITSNSFRVGGIVGLSNGIISDSEITGSSKVEGKYSSGGCFMSTVGGIAGHAGNVISNCKSTGTSVSGYGRVGGIAGFSQSTLSGNKVNSNTITNNFDISTIGENDRSTMPTTGGIVGFAISGLTNNITDATTINGAGDVGGIVGMLASSGSSSTSGNIVRNNSVVNNKKGSGRMLHTGGIIGIVADASPTSDNNDISDTTITSANNYIGGIVGFTKGEVKNSDLTNVIINQTAGKGIGGVVGYGCGYINDLQAYTNIHDCTLTSVTLNGDTEAGTICPIPAIVYSNITVDGEEYIDEVAGAREITMFDDEEDEEDDENMPNTVNKTSNNASVTPKTSVVTDTAGEENSNTDPEEQQETSDNDDESNTSNSDDIDDLSNEVDNDENAENNKSNSENKESEVEQEESEDNIED